MTQRSLFPPVIRVALALLLAAVGAFFSVVHAIRPEYAGIIGVVVMVLATQGVVPPTPRSIIVHNPGVSFVLLLITSVIAYIVNVGTLGHIDPWVQGLIVAVLAVLQSFSTPPVALPAPAPVANA